MEFAKLEAEIVRILQQAKAEAARSAQNPAIAHRPASAAAKSASMTRLLLALLAFYRRWLSPGALAGHGRMPLSAHMLGICVDGHLHAWPAARHGARALEAAALPPVYPRRPRSRSASCAGETFSPRTITIEDRGGCLTGCPLELTGRILCPKFSNPNLQTQGPGGGSGGGDMRSTIAFTLVMLVALLGYQYFFKPAAPDRAADRNNPRSRRNRKRRSPPSNKRASRRIRANAVACGIGTGRGGNSLRRRRHRVRYHGRERGLQDRLHQSRRAGEAMDLEEIVDTGRQAAGHGAAPGLGALRLSALAVYL
jgi:hypothetical protein